LNFFSVNWGVYSKNLVRNNNDNCAAPFVII
jgi:hypothetical protein